MSFLRYLRVSAAQSIPTQKIWCLDVKTREKSLILIRVIFLITYSIANVNLDTETMEIINGMVHQWPSMREEGGGTF